MKKLQLKVRPPLLPPYFKWSRCSTAPLCVLGFFRGCRSRGFANKEIFENIDWEQGLDLAREWWTSLEETELENLCTGSQVGSHARLPSLLHTFFFTGNIISATGSNLLPFLICQSLILSASEAALFLSKNAPFKCPGFSIICAAFAMMIAFLQGCMMNSAPPVTNIKASDYVQVPPFEGEKQCQVLSTEDEEQQQTQPLMSSSC
eukprot:Gb_07253 [translate_table: standard]